MARQSEALVELWRKLGAALAQYRESVPLNQTELGRKTHYSRTSISHIEAGRQFPSREFWATADETCRARGELLALHDEIRARLDALKIEEIADRQERHRTHDSFATPERAEDEQAAWELARRAAASDVGAETIARLEDVVDDLASAYSVTAPAVLLQHIRQHLRYVDRLLDARKTLTEHRRLLVVAGWLSLLAATVHIDLNHSAAATARLRTAASLARHTEHPEIHAWCYETEAWRTLTDGNHVRAVKMSLAAQELSPAGSSVAIQSTAQLGRAYARLKQPTETYAAITQVHELVAPMAKPARPEHHFRYDPDKALAYTATTLAWLGDPAAEGYAREIITRLGPTEDVAKWPRRVASAKLDLALALLSTNRLDEACETTVRALESGRVVPSNHWRALEVVEAVETRGLPEAPDLREAYETLGQE